MVLLPKMVYYSLIDLARSRILIGKVKMAQLQMGLQGTYAFRGSLGLEQAALKADLFGFDVHSQTLTRRYEVPVSYLPGSF